MTDTTSSTRPGFDPVPEDLDVLLDPAWLTEALELVGEGERVTHVRVGAQEADRALE